MLKSLLPWNSKESKEEPRTKPREKPCWKESINTLLNTNRKSLKWSSLEDKPRPMVKFSCLLNLELPLSSESEVWTSLTQDQSEFWDCSDWDNFITEPLSESTKPQSICWEELNLISLLDILQLKPLENWFSREDTERSTTKEFLWPTTELLRELWENSALFPLRIWSTRLPPLAPTSRKPTTSCGLSNLEVPEEDSLRRDILSKEEEIGETESTSLTTSSRECFDPYSYLYLNSILLWDNLVIDYQLTFILSAYYCSKS